MAKQTVCKLLASGSWAAPSAGEGWGCWRWPQSGTSPGKGSTGARVTPGLETVPLRGVGLVPCGPCGGRVRAWWSDCCGPPRSVRPRTAPPVSGSWPVQGVLQDVQEGSPQEPLGESPWWLPSSLCLFLKSSVPFHPDSQNERIHMPERILRFPKLRIWKSSLKASAESLSPAQAATGTGTRTAVSAASDAGTAPMAPSAAAVLRHPPPRPPGLLPTEGPRLQVLQERVGFALLVSTAAGGPPFPGPLSVEGTPPAPPGPLSP